MNIEEQIYDGFGIVLYLHKRYSINLFFYYFPAIFDWGHIASPLSVHTYVHPVHTINGFCAIAFEYIGVLDS